MKKATLFAVTVFVLGLASITFAAGKGPVGPPTPNAVWADGMLYGTILTPTKLPDKGPKDGLFMFEGLDGQHSVAESKPGDRDYNGGRWQSTVLRFTEEGLAVHDADDDGVADFELTSWEDVMHHWKDLGHFEEVGMGPSFVCPLKK